MRQEIQDAIIAKLKPLESDLKVRIGALDSEELKRPVMAGQVFVSYRGIEREAPFVQGPRAKNLQVTTFEVLTRFLNLRTHNQAFPILRAIDEELSGFSPVPGTQKSIRLVSEKFVEDQAFLDAGLWVFSQMFEVVTVFEQVKNFRGS